MKQISYFDGYGVRLMSDNQFEALVRDAVSKVLQTHGFRVLKPGAKARRAAQQAVADYCAAQSPSPAVASKLTGVPISFIKKYQ